MSCIVLHCERQRSIEIDPARTALACIDFQADFVLPEGRAVAEGMDVEPLSAAIPAAQRTLAAARRAGLFVFFTRECYTSDLADLNQFRRRHDAAIGSPGPLGRFLIRGERGTEIIPAMRPAAITCSVKPPKSATVFAIAI